MLSGTGLHAYLLFVFTLTPHICFSASTGLPNLALIGAFVPSLIASCYAMLSWYHWKGCSFLKGNGGGVEREKGDRKKKEEKKSKRGSHGLSPTCRAKDFTGSACFELGFLSRHSFALLLKDSQKSPWDTVVTATRYILWPTLVRPKEVVGDQLLPLG